MTDRALLQQALDALEWNLPVIEDYGDHEQLNRQHRAIIVLRKRLAQPNEFNPDWDAMAVMVEEQQRMAKRIAELEGQPVALETVYETIIQWDEGGGKRSRRELARRIAALYAAPQPQMQPCAGRNCGSTNPNLHSAECFEDYEKVTGMNQRKPLPPQSPCEMTQAEGKMFKLGWLECEAAHGIKGEA